MYTLTDVDTFTGIVVPDDGDLVNSANAARPNQDLANRTRYFYNNRIIQAVKTSDTSVNTDATVNDDPHLSINLAASTTYEIRAALFLNWGAVAPGFRVTLFGTVGVGYVNGFVDIKPTVGPNTGASGILLALGNETTAIAANLSGTTGFCRVDGTIVTTTAGTLLVRWAQETSDAALVTVMRGSRLSAIRVGG